MSVQSHMIRVITVVLLYNDYVVYNSDEMILLQI